MHIALLGNNAGWHITDLYRAATELGHRTDIVDFRALDASLGRSEKSCADWDAVIVRSMPPGSLEQIVFRMDVLHSWTQRGVNVLNPPRSLETCIDKYLAGMQLEAAGLRVPPTIVCQNTDSAMEAFYQLGGDVVVKPIFGAEGRGIVRVSDADLAWRTFRTLERMQYVLYVQQFLPHEGWDLRLFVLGDRIIAGMKRFAQNGWRTNAAQGGRCEATNWTDETAQMASHATRAIGVVMAGVDLLPANDGQWYVLEINAVPGWRALAKTTGMDVARRIIECVENPQAG